MRDTYKTVIALGAVVLSLSAGASAGVVYYTAESAGNSAWSHLYSIDTATNAITDRGVVQSQKYMTDLATDSQGKLYGVGWTNASANGTSKLYELTPGSASAPAQWDILQVKSNQMDRTVNAAVMRSGDLYVASADGTLQKLVLNAPKDRWEVAKTGNMGYASGGDLAFSEDGSRLYVTLAGGTLATVNFDISSKNFGKVTTIGRTGYAEVYGLAETEGVLYGFTNDRTNYGSSQMVKLDTHTGAAYDPVSLGVSVWGAAAGVGVVGGPVPEPMTIAVLGLGGVLVLARRRRTRQIACSC